MATNDSTTNNSPSINALNVSVSAHISNFFGNSSAYRPNKYYVGFYGEYVKKAVEKMESKATDNSKIMDGVSIYKTAMQNFKNYYDYKKINDSNAQIDLKWACEEIDIPQIKPIIDSENYIDSIKSIKYPIIKGLEPLSTIKVKICDDKNLIWYHFFNALINEFYSAQILKPKSSFQKLGMYIAVLQEQYTNSVIENGKYVTKTDEYKITHKIDSNPKKSYPCIDALPTQVFEFNSIVISELPPLPFRNNCEDIMRYSVSFAAPNPFQGSFKNKFKGLADNTSGGIDSNALTSTESYNKNSFEVSTSDLKSTSNGYYTD